MAYNFVCREHKDEKDVMIFFALKIGFDVHYIIYTHKTVHDYTHTNQDKNRSCMHKICANSKRL